MCSANTYGVQQSAFGLKVCGLGAGCFNDFGTPFPFEVLPCLRSGSRVCFGAIQILSYKASLSVIL